MKVAIVLAEFGKPAPATSQFRHYFPDADIQVFGDELPNLFSDHPRSGWRLNDYWKVKKLLEADADIAIAFDSDMRIVSDDVKTLPILAEAFGLCLPANPRQRVSVDTHIGADSDGRLDETRGTGYAYNCTPIALNLSHYQAVACAEQYCREMQSNPVRGPLAWWRAAWAIRFAPYLLPPQWCVCEKDIGCGDEIILHEGHDRVRAHYRNVR